jgi:hypothetical protein
LVVPLTQQANRHEDFGTGTPIFSGIFISVDPDSMVQINQESLFLVFRNQDVPDRDISMQDFAPKKILMPCLS